ncbi:MAG: thioredoxin domain-containing protein [Candidatus Uhrbacteria bacterium]
MDNEKKPSWVDGIPPRAALGLGVALGIGAIGIIGSLVLIPGAIKGQTNKTATPPAAEEPAPTAPTPKPEDAAPTAPINIAVIDRDHVRGSADAAVTIVEWSDFQCPFCSQFHETMQRAFSEYNGKIRWVFRHFPLDSLHPNARPAAEAAECASEQGKFWEFADALFAKQDELGTDFYSKLAKDLGLDGAKFAECVKSRKYQQRVEDDEQEGLKVGVRGTPGSYVSGVEVPGAVPLNQLKAMIDSALKTN